MVIIKNLPAMQRQQNSRPINMMRGLGSLCCLLGLLCPVFTLAAETKVWSVASSEALIAALEQAPPQARIELAAGVYQGQFVVSKPLSIIGQPGAHLKSSGSTVLQVNASDVLIQGLEISGYPQALFGRTSGILVQGEHHNVIIEHNTLSGQGFGIRADQAHDIIVRHNQIEGDPRLSLVLRGDGIHLNHVQGGQVYQNQIARVRDGVYLEQSQLIDVWDNQMQDQQYPVHLMYAEQIAIWNNQAEHVLGGWALMDSERVKLHDNFVSHAKEFGILLNMTFGAQIWDNYVVHTRNPDKHKVFDGEGKGLFVYGASDNEVYQNHFLDNDIGIMMALGGEDNQLHQNAFIGNEVQVKYVGEGRVIWNQQRGNYWSSYRGWDLNRDGIGDKAYVPNDALDRLFWTFPEAKFLLDSPVVQVIRFFAGQGHERQSGVVDLFPLMAPPPLSATTSTYVANHLEKSS